MLGDLGILPAILIVTGAFFMLVAAVGVIRFPDFYSRCHPAGKTDTLGQGLILIGLIIHQGADLTAMRMFFIFLFISIANPTATHAQMRAAYVAGLKFWSKEKQS